MKRLQVQINHFLLPVLAIWTLSLVISDICLWDAYQVSAQGPPGGDPNRDPVKARVEAEFDAIEERGDDEDIHGAWSVPGLGVFDTGVCMTLRLSRTIVTLARGAFLRKYLPAMLIGVNTTIDMVDAKVRVGMAMTLINDARDDCERRNNEYNRKFYRNSDD